MYVRSDIKPSIILWFCWRHLVFFALYSLAVYLAYHKLHLKALAIPFLPVGTIGTAVAFYVGFKNNASYERLWEARKIWGAIASHCRAWGAILAAGHRSLSPAAKAMRYQLLIRQIKWCHMLGIMLRSRPAARNSHKVAPEIALVKARCAPPECSAQVLQSYMETDLASADFERVKHAVNPAVALLALQIEDIDVRAEELKIDDRAKEKLLEVALGCINEQGAAERLKHFPFPRQYAYFSGVFVWIFLLLLPFGLIDELVKSQAHGLDWMVVPFSTLISWMFITMEQVGDSSEDPFEQGLNDVPVSAICRDVEIDLRQFFDDADVSPQLVPVEDILL